MKRERKNKMNAIGSPCYLMHNKRLHNWCRGTQETKGTERDGMHLFGRASCGRERDKQMFRVFRDFSLKHGFVYRSQMFQVNSGMFWWLRIIENVCLLVFC